MIRAIFISILFIGSITGSYSQNRMPQNPGRIDLGKVEANLVQYAKEEYSLCLSFRISYAELIFSKEETSYASGIEFSCEVYDGEKLVERKSISEHVKVAKYAETLDKNSFIQSALTFKLTKSKFAIRPALLRVNTNTTLQMHEIDLDLIQNGKIIRPVIVAKTPSVNEFELVNREATIPYDGNSYSLLVPVPDSLADVSLKIEQKGITLKDTLISKPVKNTIQLNKKDGALIAGFVSKTEDNYSYVKIDLPEKIDEGDLQILLESKKKKALFNIPVIWLDKPMVLMDLDLSIRLLKIITDEKRADFIGDQPSDKRYDLLKQEWNKITKSEKGGLNILMKEFYTRADYALMNFSYNGRRNGAESDRGKVYIKFGKPSDVERNYNDKNEIIEIWSYDNINREFIFEDTSGNGNYILRK